MNRLESCLKTVICNGWLKDECCDQQFVDKKTWKVRKKNHIVSIFDAVVKKLMMRQIVGLLFSLLNYFCTPRKGKSCSSEVRGEIQLQLPLPLQCFAHGHVSRADGRHHRGHEPRLSAKKTLSEQLVVWFILL